MHNCLGQLFAYVIVVVYVTDFLWYAVAFFSDLLTCTMTPAEPCGITEASALQFQLKHQQEAAVLVYDHAENERWLRWLMIT